MGDVRNRYASVPGSAFWNAIASGRDGAERDALAVTKPIAAATVRRRARIAVKCLIWLKFVSFMKSSFGRE